MPWEIIEGRPCSRPLSIVPMARETGVWRNSHCKQKPITDIEIIAVQSAQAPGMQLSWLMAQWQKQKCRQFAEGLATRVPFENTQRIMREYVDDFILVEDKDIISAITILLEHTHNLVEETSSCSP